MLLGALVVLVATAAPAAAEVDLGVFSGPLRFNAPDGAVLDLGERRYVGTIEAAVGGGGMTVVDELALDAYLEGLAEVPLSWPVPTLEAQVMAARTYAWWELEQGAWTSRGYDICATQACQVFAGRDLVEGPGGDRWAAAVDATSGRALVDAAGDPLLARYSSSNGGRSRANVEVFPDDGDLPYLQPVDDPHDAVSPFHTWQVRFPRPDLDAILARGQTLSAAVPLADIRLVPVDGGEDLVEVVGQDGTVAAVTASEFRFFVSAVAPDIDPTAYPAPRPDAVDRRYPTTLLSSQLAFTVTDDEVVVDGRGFGHGVGMSQYGALGKAEVGFTADEILAAYYNGITPSAPDDLPAQVRVGLAEDVTSIEVTPSAPTRVTVGGTELTARALGGWRVVTRPDRTLQVFAPDGYGSPLVVDATTVDRPAPWPVEVVTLSTVVNKFVELEVEVRETGGDVVARTPVGVVEPGRHDVDWSLEGPDGGLLPPGDYAVSLVAIDEEGTRAGGPTEVAVRAPTLVAAGPALGPAPPAPTRSPLPLPVALAAAVVVGAAVGVAGAGVARRRTT